VIEFSNPVRAMALTSYATRLNQAHRRDEQLKLFARKELRPVWRSRKEIAAHLASRQNSNNALAQEPKIVQQQWSCQEKVALWWVSPKWFLAGKPAGFFSKTLCPFTSLIFCYFGFGILAALFWRSCQSRVCHLNHQKTSRGEVVVIIIVSVNLHYSNIRFWF